MSRRLEELQKPQIRKSFLVIGGAALGAALLGFVLMNFVFGGDGGGGPAVPPASGNAAVTQSKLLPEKEHTPLRPGGRDPFIVGSGSGAQAAAVAAAVATPAPTASPAPAKVASKKVYYEVLSTTEESADVRVGGKEFKNATPGTKVSEDSSVFSIADDCVIFRKGGERFQVCIGERHLA